MNGRFEVKEGIVIDNQTGLMWMQSPLDKLYTWADACEIRHSFGGFDDWRLPSIQELVGILDFETSNPACSKVFLFGGCEKFWSASLYIGFPYAWYVDFYEGVFNEYKNYDFAVRLVRRNCLQENYTKYPILEVQNLDKKITELSLWKADALERIETLEKELLEESEHTKTINNVLKVLTEALDSVSKEAKLAILDYRNEELFAKFNNLVEKEAKKVNRKPRNHS